jgi:hypothetical protein
LVRKIFEEFGKKIEEYYLARLHQEIEKTLLDACVKFKASKHLKKNFIMINQPLCNNFKEIFDYWLL